MLSCNIVELPSPLPPSPVLPEEQYNNKSLRKQSIKHPADSDNYIPLETCHSGPVIDQRQMEGQVYAYPPNHRNSLSNGISESTKESHLSRKNSEGDPMVASREAYSSTVDRLSHHSAASSVDEDYDVPRAMRRLQNPVSEDYDVPPFQRSVDMLSNNNFNLDRRANENYDSVPPLPSIVDDDDDYDVPRGHSGYKGRSASSLMQHTKVTELDFASTNSPSLYGKPVSKSQSSVGNCKVPPSTVIHSGVKPVSNKHQVSPLDLSKVTNVLATNESRYVNMPGEEDEQSVGHASLNMDEVYDIPRPRPSIDEIAPPPVAHGTVQVHRYINAAGAYVLREDDVSVEKNRSAHEAEKYVNIGDDNNIYSSPPNSSRISVSPGIITPTSVFKVDWKLYKIV